MKKIELSAFFFSAFDMSVNSAEKSVLNLVKLPSLKVVCDKLRKLWLIKSRNFTNVCIVGGTSLPPPPPTIQVTSVNFHNYIIHLKALSKNTLLCILQISPWCLI